METLKYTVLPFIKKSWIRLGLILVLCIILLQDSMMLSFSSKGIFYQGSSATLWEKQEAEKSPSLIPGKDLSDLPTYKGELARIPDEMREAYIRRFSHVAVGEMKKYDIPASIILANSLLHSEAGTRDMAVKGNNHFALPCTLDWLSKSDMYGGVCYRHFDNAWMSFRNHSVYLETPPFIHLKSLGTKDYKGWAKGLEEAKYSNYENLMQELISLIESYDLTRFDNR